jgi:hypothetical protein
MSKVLQALPPPEESQASQALPTACPPTLRCRQLPQPVVALYNWAGLCPVRRSWPLWPGAKPKDHSFGGCAMCQCLLVWPSWGEAKRPSKDSLPIHTHCP